MSHRLKLGQAPAPTNTLTRRFGPAGIMGAARGMGDGLRNSKEVEAEIPGVGHQHDVQAMGVNPGMGQGGAQDKFAQKIMAMSAQDFAKLMQKLGAGPIT